MKSFCSPPVTGLKYTASNGINRDHWIHSGRRWAAVSLIFVCRVTSVKTVKRSAISFASPVGWIRWCLVRQKLSAR